MVVVEVEQGEENDPVEVESNNIRGQYYASCTFMVHREVKELLSLKKAITCSCCYASTSFGYGDGGE